MSRVWEGLVKRAGFEMMEEYIQRRQNTVAQYIATQSLLVLCEEMERTPGAGVGMRWWEQADIDLMGLRETEAAAADEEKDKDEDALEK